MGDTITMSKDIEKLIETIKSWRTELVKIAKNQDKSIASLVTELYKQGEEVTNLLKDVESLKKQVTKLEKRTKESIF